MDFSITGAIDQTASMFLDDGDTPPYATFEPNFFAGWAHTKKNMHPELTTKVKSVVHECWGAGENKELGKVKISAAGKVCYSDCDMQKDISMWNKQELQAYLIHHNLKKSGNKPDLVLRIRQHMDTV